jgi:hypothetical protein
LLANVPRETTGDYMVDYGKMAREAAAEEKLIFTNPSMKKLRELPFAETDWKLYKHLSKEMLDKSNFKEYKKADVTKVYKYATKLLDDYEKATMKRFEELRKQWRKEWDNEKKNLQKESDELFL